MPRSKQFTSSEARKPALKKFDNDAITATQEPHNLPSLRIAELFVIANENPDASKRRRVQGRRIEQITERERAAAVRKLLREFRTQKEQFGRNEIAQIDPLLVQGIRDWGSRIFAAEEPVLALEELLGKRRKRGKRASAKTADRDSQIVRDMLERMRSGMSLEKAAEALAPDYGIGPESIAKIYKRGHKAAKAEIAMSELERRG